MVEVVELPLSEGLPASATKVGCANNLIENNNVVIPKTTIGLKKDLDTIVAFMEGGL